MRVVWAIALVILLSGCTGKETVPAPSTAEEPDVIFSDDRITISDLGPVVEQAPTLLEPPRWQRGEWWDYEVTEFFAGQPYTSTMVIAGAEQDDYLVGMPTHDFSNGIMVLHVPGFGQAAKDDLSYEIHDCRFHPLKFPLTLDNNWTTQFECRDVNATVTEVTETTATVELIGNGDYIVLTYDAVQRNIVSFINHGYAEYKVTGHGKAFHDEKPGMEGLVTVPHMHDVIFMHGRVAGGLIGAGSDGYGPANTSPPTDTIEVATTYDRVSFVIATGNLWFLMPNGLGDSVPVGGMYRLTATAPDGAKYVLEQQPTDPAHFKMMFAKHDNPGGTWTLEHLATGPGLTSAEGIAYHVYDVEVDTGRILPSIGEHQHGDHDGH